jgi:hypothetical protein|tara:strand:+ start:1296 stop:3398 length:2103 start_codon:yes stop_codon:yes gene_type:complete
MATNKLEGRSRAKARDVLTIASKSKRKMKLSELQFTNSAKFIRSQAKIISRPKIDKRKLKEVLNTNFGDLAANAADGRGGGLLPLGLGGFGGGGGRGRGGRGGRRGGPPSRRAQQRYRRRFGNRAGNRRFGRLPQFGRATKGVRIPRAGGVLGVAMAGLEYGGRLSDGQTQTQAITGTAASTAGGLAGGFAGAKGGAALGALIGSVVPGAGTAIGAAIGGLIGGIAGGMAGSSLAGGAADKLTGVRGEKYIGEDDKKKKTKKNDMNVELLATLSRFDKVVSKFEKLGVGGDLEELELTNLKSFSGREIPLELTPQVIALEDEYLKTGKTQSLMTEQGFLKVGPTAPNRLDLGGFLGLSGPDLSPQISYNPNLTPKTNEEAVAQAELLFTAANLPATLSPFMGAKRAQPKVQYGPAFQGPLPAPIASPRSRIVRGANTLPRPESTPVTPLTERLAPFLRPTPATRRKKFAPNPFETATPRELTGQGRPRLTGKDNRVASETFAKRGQAEDDMSGRTGAMEQRANNDRQNLKFVQDVLGRSPNERGKLTKEVIKYDDGPVEFKRPGGDFITSEEYILRRLRKEYPGQDIDKLLDTSKPSIKEELLNFQGKKIGDQGSANIKPGSQEIASADIGKSGGINQYTTYNSPNNTFIIQNGGQTIAAAPPPAQVVSQNNSPNPTQGVNMMDIVNKYNNTMLLTSLSA